VPGRDDGGRAAASLALLAQAVDRANQGLVICDSEGKVVLRNAPARELMNARDGDLLAEKAVEAALGRALTGADHEEILDLYSPTRHTLEIRAFPLGGDGAGQKPSGAVALVDDVSELRRLEAVRRDFVANLSHELKTPLTSMSMAIHLLLEESVGPLAPKQVELLLDARASSDRLLAMINNLLDLARLEKGASHLDVRPEQPASLVNAAAELVRRRAEDQGVELVVDASPSLPRVAADATVLGHALHNLLDNALKYTPSGGRITLTASSAGQFVCLTIADTGAGIPAENLPHVFEKFFRIPGQDRGSGTGLGLAIVREIVLAHSGDVTCTSEQGKGTVFRLTLPVWHGTG